MASVGRLLWCFVRRGSATGFAVLLVSRVSGSDVYSLASGSSPITRWWYLHAGGVPAMRRLHVAAAMSEGFDCAESARVTSAVHPTLFSQ